MLITLGLTLLAYLGKKNEVHFRTFSFEAFKHNKKKTSAEKIYQNLNYGK